MKATLPVERVKEIINEEINFFMDRKNRELINENSLDLRNDHPAVDFDIGDFVLHNTYQRNGQVVQKIAPHGENVYMVKFDKPFRFYADTVSQVWATARDLRKV